MDDLKFAPDRETEPNRTETQERPAYVPPAVIYEASLEVRAGTPSKMPDPLDLFGGTGN